MRAVVVQTDDTLVFVYPFVAPRLVSVETYVETLETRTRMKFDLLYIADYQGRIS